MPQFQKIDGLRASTLNLALTTASTDARQHARKHARERREGCCRQRSKPHFPPAKRARPARADARFADLRAIV